MHQRLVALSILSLLSLAACTKDAEDTGDSAVASEPTWAEMDADQKNAYMASTVTPQMAELFQAYNADAYASFTCNTCHTDGGDYSMPTSDLYGFDPAAIPGADEGDGYAFMHNEVVPKMQELLDDESFGCLNCHPAAN
ncbi:MAG: hypothetical protein VX899_20650 [Myxococcota bacterium]|nr:hypothetical protein [Myxococcota bacterium]